MGRADSDRRNTTKKAQEFFLREFEECGIVGRACRAAGIHRSTYYRWYENDEDFRGRAREAKADAVDRLEEEARRRAHDGTERPVFYRGQECGYIREYSDTLLIFLLKAHDPERFAERTKTEITPGGDSDGLTIIFGGQKVTDGPPPTPSRGERPAKEK